MNRRFHFDFLPGRKRSGMREEATGYVRTHLREHPGLQPHRGRWRLQIRFTDEAVTARLTRGAMVITSRWRTDPGAWWMPEPWEHTPEARYENVVESLAAGLLRWLQTFGEVDETGWLRVAVWRDPELEGRYHLGPVEGIPRTLILLAPGITVAQERTDACAMVHRLDGDRLRVVGTVATALASGWAQVVN